MIENAYYGHEAHGDYELVSVGELLLEDGGVIPDCQLAVATFGTLSAAKDNAILVSTWYSGTHQIWRDAYIGEGHALDPSKYFIVVIDQIGSGLSTSPHNASDGPRFPHVRIGDDVVAQERLLREHFGIEKLALVVGGSMGAQQTYEWAVRFPEMVPRAAAFAGTALAVRLPAASVRQAPTVTARDLSFVPAQAIIPPPAPYDPPVAAVPPVVQAISAPPLLLIAEPGDSLPALYERVYHGLVGPHYSDVVAANPRPLQSGMLVHFPPPAGGWNMSIGAAPARSQ